MRKENKQSCCFIGHRKINISDDLVNKLKNIISELILNNNVDTFLFGSKSEFDDLCHKLVTEQKNKHPHIKRIYVRAEYPNINDNYKNYLLQSYEDTYFPPKIIWAGKAVYIERNYEMIDKCKFCVVYYDKKRSCTTKNSGTSLAYNYAEKQDICIINVFDI